MNIDEAKRITHYQRVVGLHRDGSAALEWAICEIERLNTILYGSPTPASETPDVAVGPLMSVPQFFGMLSELRDSTMMAEAAASAGMAVDADGVPEVKP